MFVALKLRKGSARQLKVFLFGGPDGVAQTAASALNAGAHGVVCVGALNPGFGSLEALSGEKVLSEINASNADFLLVALGAAKGQLWLKRNHDRLKIPVRAHLGAVINFEAGTIKRAPKPWQHLGLEWVWRIKEEPRLWTSYVRDGVTLLRLLLTKVMPLLAAQYLFKTDARERLICRSIQTGYSTLLVLSGAATVTNIADATAHFRKALRVRRQCLIIDLAGVQTLDARFLGLLLMLRKCLTQQGAALQLVGASTALQRRMRWHGADFLLAPAPVT